MRNERNVTQTLYIEIHVSRWIERCRELSRIKTCKLTVEELSRIYREVFIAKGSRWIEKLSSIQKVPRWIEQLSSIQKVPRWIEQLSSNYRECDKKKLKRLNRQPSCREVSSSCQDYLKIVFQRREKYRYECNQPCYSTKDPNNILNSQKHLSTRKILITWIQNIHTR